MAERKRYREPRRLSLARSERKRLLYKQDNSPYRDRALRKNYGIGLETYNIMLQMQNGVCAICGKVNPDGKALAVDHDHITGRVRGLLCAKCNWAIGNFGDNSKMLKRAFEYLEKGGS